MAEKVLAVFLMKLHEVEKVTGKKKTSIYEGMKNGSFPVAVRLSSRSVGWRSDSISEWIESRPKVDLT